MTLVLSVAAATSARSAVGSAGAARGHAGATAGLRLGDNLTTILPGGSLEPGEAIHGRQLVVNDRAQPLRYALSSTSDDRDGKGVREILHVTIRAADLPSGGAPTCDRFDGSILYDGQLGAATAGFGDTRTGGQPGDRLLGPGEGETLCFEMTMPFDAGNEYQRASSATIWTFAAEQAEGNP